MKQYKVIKNGVVTNEWTSDFAGPDYYEPCFGKSDRWVTAEQEDVSGATDTRTVTDGLGNFRTEYFLTKEYEIVEKDITAQVEAEKTKKDRMKKDRDDRVTNLKSIDWNAVNTNAELKAIVKHLVDDNLKDEQ